jgi:hypothetical protein
VMAQKLMLGHLAQLSMWSDEIWARPFRKPL